MARNNGTITGTPARSERMLYQLEVIPTPRRLGRRNPSLRVLWLFLSSTSTGVIPLVHKAQHSTLRPGTADRSASIVTMEIMPRSAWLVHRLGDFVGFVCLPGGLPLGFFFRSRSSSGGIASNAATHRAIDSGSSPCSSSTIPRNGTADSAHHNDTAALWPICLFVEDDLTILQDTC